MIPTSIDGTDITGATIDGQDVQEITVDGQTVFTAGPVLPDSAIARWSFEDDLNTSTAVDSIGSFDGNINGATYSTQSQVGDNSLFFDGVDDDVTIGSSSGLRIVPFSVTGWFRLDNKSKIHTFVSYRDDNNHGFEIQYNDSTDDIEAITFDGNFHKLLAGIGPPVNTFVFFGFTWENGVGNIYVDGSPEASGSLPLSTNTNQNIAFGLSTSFNEHRLKGNLDEVLWYNEKLSGSQIQSEYNRSI